MKERPLHDRVLVRREEEVSKTAGGILLATKSREKSNRGVVVAVGPGKVLDDGKLSPMTVKVGDVVVFGNYAGNQEIKDGEDVIVIMTEKDIYGVVSE